ncbi:hypothetical protein HR12_44810, partial [Microbacterium sp. SUBG005]
MNLERQQAKIVAAVNGLGADVVSLEEIENSAVFGKDRDDALSTLVDALNAALGARRVDLRPLAGSPPGVGGRHPHRLHLQEGRRAGRRQRHPGRPGVLERPSATRAGLRSRRTRGCQDPRDREPLQVEGRQRPAATGDNANGIQGAFNGDRVRQAQALGAFAAERSAAVGTDDVFLLGDFNAYT